MTSTRKKNLGRASALCVGAAFFAGAAVAGPQPVKIALSPATPGAENRFMAHCGVNPALEKPDLLFESFETAEKHFSERNYYGKARYRLEIRDGIASEGMRCLHLDMERALDPAISKMCERVELTFPVPKEINLADYEALTFRGRLQTAGAMEWWYVLFEDDVALWRGGANLDPSRIGEWQIAKIPLKHLNWFQEGPKAPPDRKKCNLAAVRHIKLQLSGGRKCASSFDIDEIGFTRKSDPYEGLRISTIQAWPDSYWHIGTNAPFKATARLTAKKPCKKDLTATFATIDFFGQTNLLGEATIPAGVTNAVVPLSLELKDYGFAWLTGVITYGQKPIQQFRRGYSIARGPRPGCEGPNPDSIFGSWVGGPLAAMGAKWSRHIFRSDTVAPGSEKFPEKPDETCLRRQPKDIHNSFFCFCYTPPWLNGHLDEPQGYRWAPTDMEKYADWVSYIVKQNQQFGGYDNFEIWNEPVPYAGWMGSVESLVETTKATWKGVKRVQPDAKILGPCPYSFCPELVEEFFAKGGTNWIDDVVIHAYHTPPPDGEFLEGVRNTKRLMRKYGLGDRKLYITEVGYDSPSTDTHDIASFLPRVFAYGLSEGVSAIIWHMGQALSHEGLNESTLLKKDTSANPSFTAYCAMTHVLERAHYAGVAPGLGATQVGFDFSREDGAKVRMMWDKAAKRGDAGTPYSWKGTKPVEVINVMGAARTLTPDANGVFTLSLARDPVYVISR